MTPRVLRTARLAVHRLGALAVLNRLVSSSGQAFSERALDDGYPARSRVNALAYLDIARRAAKLPERDKYLRRRAVPNSLS